MLYSQHNRFPHRHARSHFICRGLFFLLILAGCTPAPPTQSGVLPPITIADARLRAGGEAFEVRGVNYIHPSTADLSKCPALQFGADGNCPWDIAPIANDSSGSVARSRQQRRVYVRRYVTAVLNQSADFFDHCAAQIVLSSPCESRIPWRLPPTRSIYPNHAGRRFGRAS